MQCEFSSTALHNGYYQITIHAPDLAQQAEPGHFISIDEKFNCYLLGASIDLNIIATPRLATYLEHKRHIGLSALQGQALKKPEKDIFYVLSAQDDALSLIIFYLKRYRQYFKGLVILGTSSSFAFAPCPSRLVIPGFPADVIGALPLFEDWGIPSRLASLNELPGAYHSDARSLCELWLANTKQTTAQTLHFSGCEHQPDKKLAML